MQPKEENCNYVEDEIKFQILFIRMFFCPAFWDAVEFEFQIVWFAQNAFFKLRVKEVV